MNIVQSAFALGTTLTLSAVQAGSSILVGFACQGSAQASAVTFAGNAMTQQGAGQVTNIIAESWWLINNVAAGGTSVVVTVSGSTSPIVWAAEISGGPLTLDKSVIGSGTNGAGTKPWSIGPTATTSQAVELWAGLVYVRTSGGLTSITGPGTPWSSAGQLDAGSTHGMDAGTQITSATGTATFAGTVALLGSSNPFAGEIVTFTAPAAAAVPKQPPPVPPRRAMSRAVVQFSAGVTANAGAAGVPRQAAPVLPRRVLARAVVQFRPGMTVNAGAAGIPRQSPVRYPRRVLTRALVQFRPGVTVNAAAIIPAPVPQPACTLQIPRRTLSRAYIQFKPVVTINAPVVSAGSGILWLPRRRTRRGYVRSYQWTLMP